MNQPAPRRKRSRSRKRGGNANNNAKNPANNAKNTGNANGGNRAGSNGSRNSPRKNQPKVDPREFWGDKEALPERIDGLTHSPDVRAVLTSLGRPPLTGNETAAEHWFSMVYERSAFLAGALAAAGDLDADEEVDD